MNDTVSQQNHPTIESLAKNYRIQYVQKLKETIKVKVPQTEKRSLESPTMIQSKRSCSSATTTTNTLQILRNRIREEENNEQFYFNDERRM